MELQFNKSTVPCLDTVLQEIQNTEQTLEMKLPDGMPDIGHMISAWGQVILRSKEWRGDSVCLTGGCQVWVLYAPEDGGQERTMAGWMPFQMKWDLPAGTREGDIQVMCMLRSVDARSVSARKIMVRAGVAALAEAFAPMEAELFSPDAGDQEVELLRTVYPMRLLKEAGEKTFLLDEELTLPESAPAMESLLYYRMDPQILDKKVLANKAVFRGSGNLHFLYRSPEGQVQGWDFDLPFSQFAELNSEYGSDAQIDVLPQVTAVELEPEEGRLRLKGGIAAQYLITDKELLKMIEDAYAPGRAVDLQTKPLEVPAILDIRRELLYPELSIPADAREVLDVQFLPDFPIQRRQESSVNMELPGSFQVLYAGEDGALRGSASRWSGQLTINAHEDSTLRCLPRCMEPQGTAGGGGITLKAQLPLDITTVTCQSIPMVTGAEVGQPTAPDPGRPSLILKRAGTGRLWDMAKENDTTTAAIKKANNLQDEPSPGQMLLIPIG